MPTADLTTLFQRLADSLVRLFSERVDLARVEIREEVERLVRLLAKLLLGAVAAAVGLVMLALAMTDVLLPFVHSRAGRLFLIGAPLLGFGTMHILRIARQLPRKPAAPPPDPEALAEVEQHLNGVPERRE